MKLQAEADISLLDVLKKLFPDSSRRTFQGWLKAERVAVDDQVVKKDSLIVKKGQQVVVGPRLTKPIPGVRVLYDDAHLIVIEKPAGLLSVASEDPIEKHAHGILKDAFRPQRIFPVHRLDRETSGVMMFARSEAARAKLKEILEQHDLEREYVAVVEGKVEPSQGIWQSHLIENSQYVVFSSPHANEGRLAITHFSVIAQNNERSLLSLTLETGRKNQIRVHCQDAGHPVVGDMKYGSKLNLIGRLCLHAKRLAFLHPITHKPLSFEIPEPPQFHKLVGLKSPV